MIEYVKIGLSFSAKSECFLPIFWGSTLRGLFKTGLRRISCQNGNNRCSNCIWRPDCAYALISEYTTDTGENTVQPYTISCPSNRTGFLDAGETISMSMLLIGNAIQYIPTILTACEGWRAMDMAFYKFFVTEAQIEQFKGFDNWIEQIKPRGKLHLKTASQIMQNGECNKIYDFGKLCRLPATERLHYPDNVQENSWRIKIRLLSPMRLFRKLRNHPNSNGKKQLIRPETFSLEIFIRAILTRYWGFENNFGCPESMASENGASADAIESARTASIRHNGLIVEKIRRYSRDMDRWEHLDGLMGEVIFENVPGVLIPWIMIGELLQVGKFPTQGYGEYAADYELMVSK